NGMIDPDEMSDRSRGFLQRAAERAGLDMSQPLPVDKLTDAFSQMREDRGSDGDRREGDRGDRSDGDRGRDSNRGDDNGRDRDRDDNDRDQSRSESSSSRTPAPRTPGFGVADSAAKAPGFDVPL